MRRPPLQPGDAIDGFTLVERVHRGNMSSLWRVGRDGLDLPLVMKIPRLGYGDDPTGIVGFEVETMIMPTLSGPHVPRFVAAGDFETLPYLVTEWIGGGALSERLGPLPLPPGEVAALGAKIATALHDLHRQHVIHLDLKPNNVMFRDSGEAVLIDFGLSRHDRLPDLLAEEFRLPMGTAAYISPEQVLHVRNDPRSDLFALGVLLYHLATGDLPFGAPTSRGGLRRRLWKDPLPPRWSFPDFPPWLQEVILGCLEIDPGQRWPTAARVAFLLQNPGQVPLTRRAAFQEYDGIVDVFRRWLRSLGSEPVLRHSLSDYLSQAPFVVAAVDTRHGGALAEAQRATVRRLLDATPGARLGCLAVMKTSRLGMDINVDKEGNNLHVKALVELKHWARPMGLPPERVTFHALEAPDPATAILDFARANQVDHLVVGARAQSRLRQYLGSVSAQIVANAPCTVTVVRASEAGSRDK